MYFCPKKLLSVCALLGQPLNKSVATVESLVLWLTGCVLCATVEATKQESVLGMQSPSRLVDTFWLDQNSDWSIFGMLITCCYGSAGHSRSSPSQCCVPLWHLTSSEGKYQVLIGVFSEQPCYTGNSVSSENPPCFHYFGLAQPPEGLGLVVC